MDLIEVEVTCPDAATARALGHAAVEARLAACAWVIPGVEAVYRWQGAVEAAPEVLLRLKSHAAVFAALCALIRQTHPYDVPAIVALPVRMLGPGVEPWWRAETDAPERGASE